MDVELETVVSVSAEKLAKSMSFEEIASFLSEVALRFDQDFKQRTYLAKTFENGLSGALNSNILFCIAGFVGRETFPIPTLITA